MSPAVVFLHGLGQPADQVDRVAQALRDALPHELHCPNYSDASGAGAAPFPLVADALNLVIDAIREDLETRPPGSRCHLIGYSFGGWLAALLGTMGSASSDAPRSCSVGLRTR